MNDVPNFDPQLEVAARSKGSPFSMPEVRITLLYVLLASGWIIGSDALLAYLVGARDESVVFQSFKGLNFVLTTGILLFFVLRRAFGGWRHSEELRLAALRSARECYRRLSARTESLREEERTRISREIHDELGQLLTGIKMQLRLIENHLAERDDRTLNPIIDELVESSGIIDELITAVQRISSGLRPLALDDLGLAEALDEEAEHFSRRTGIKCHLTIGEMNEPIPPAIGTAAFRIFQESLTNVARHADAHLIQAAGSIQDGVLTLSVHDDGVGINPATIECPTSLGLIGMLERAAEVGGKLRFKTSIGHGTEVILTIPLANAKSPSLIPGL